MVSKRLNDHYLRSYEQFWYNRIYQCIFDSKKLIQIDQKMRYYPLRVKKRPFLKKVGPFFKRWGQKKKTIMYIHPWFQAITNSPQIRDFFFNPIAVVFWAKNRVLCKAPPPKKKRRSIYIPIYLSYTVSRNNLMTNI